MKIAVVGTGYVGLITSISLAKIGHTVSCIEQNKDKVSLIQNGKSPFYEPGVDKYLTNLITKKLLAATNQLEENIKSADIIFIAVGTPNKKGQIDLSQIKKATKEIGLAIKKVKKYQVIAIKSTVLPGVTETTVKPLLHKYSGKKIGQFGLVMNPEFLREGSALEDALHPDRIVIGQADEKSGREFAKVYEQQSCPKVFTNLWTAEMIKYAANALFATLISYSNEIARISEHTGKIDVIDVWHGVHLDKRLSPFNGKTRIKPGILSYIFSGCGFGGSCFPKDVKALNSFSTSLGLKAPLIKSVIDINSQQYQRLILLLRQMLAQNFSNKKIAVLGLAFKPDTDDIRESVAFPLIKALLAEKAQVFCHDPQAKIPQVSPYSSVNQVKAVEEALQDADAAIITTAWDEYIRLTPKIFKKYMKQPVVIDGRRIFSKELFIKKGVKYTGIGFNPK